MATSVTANIQHSDLQITLFNTLINAQIFNSVKELENWFATNNMAAYQLANKPVENFNKFICSAFSKLVEQTFLNITDKLKTKLTGVPASQLTSAKLAEAGNFTIDVKFLDTTTKTNKQRTHTVSYSDMFTKFNIFKQAIDKAFDTTEIYISQSEFMYKFFNQTLSLLNMNVASARKLFESISATEQCESADTITWPDAHPPDRFNTQFHWQRYCYICGNPITPGYPPQCEHIIPLMEACAFNCLIQKSTNITTASEESKKLYKLEYAGAHKCCNLLKRISFIIINSNNNPPISINIVAINKLLTEISSKAGGPDDSDRLGCVNITKTKIPIPDITKQRNNIITNYLQPIVDLLNAKLAIPTGTQYSTSGLILLYIRINQFLEFQPSIQQTILSILTGSVKTEMTYIKVLTSAPFKIRERLENEIIDKIQLDPFSDSHHLLDIGFTQDEVSEFIKHFVSKAHITQRIGAKGFIDLFNWIPKFPDYPDIKPGKKAFQSYNYFFNINHPSNSFDNSHFKRVQNNPTTANSPLPNKIKYFFKSLIEMFYSKASQGISKKEEETLSKLCEMYIGMEFTYIISYYLINTNWTKGIILETKLQTCHANYNNSYIDFVTYFFIYQLLHILYHLNYVHADITPVDGITPPDIIQELAGETFLNLYRFSYSIDQGKGLIDSFITNAIQTLEPTNTILQDTDSELPQITLLVTQYKDLFFELFNTLLNPLNTNIIVVKNPVMSKKLSMLFEPIDSIPQPPIRGGMLPEKENIRNRDLGQRGTRPTGIVKPRIKKQPIISKILNKSKKNRDDGEGDEEGEMMEGEMMEGNEEGEMMEGNEEGERMEGNMTESERMEGNMTESERMGIMGLMKHILDSISTHGYDLRPNPTPVLQVNIDKNIERLVNDTIRICIYKRAYISTIYRCILIDSGFIIKIQEMITRRVVYSNGEILDDTDIKLLEDLIAFKKDNTLIRPGYDELFNDETFFSRHPKYLPLFEKCNLFLYYNSADYSVRDIYDNKLYAASHRGGGKKYYKKITEKLKNKKIVKKTKEKLKTKTRKHKSKKHKLRKYKSKKHKSKKHKSRKHKSKFTKTLKKKI